MSNPMDVLEVARDLVRRDELERLFIEVNDEYKKFEDENADEMLTSGNGYLSGLNFAMDLLDMRIGFLRDKWTDSGVL